MDYNGVVSQYSILIVHVDCQLINNSFLCFHIYHRSTVVKKRKLDTVSSNWLTKSVVVLLSLDKTLTFFILLSSRKLLNYL